VGAPPRYGDDVVVLQERLYKMEIVSRLHHFHVGLDLQAIGSGCKSESDVVALGLEQGELRFEDSDLDKGRRRLQCVEERQEVTF